LKKELSIFTFENLLEWYPYRHIDRTEVRPISDMVPGTDFIQVSGRLVSHEIMGEKRGRRLVASLRDASGTVELVWFQGIQWVQKMLETGREYLVYGRAGFFMGQPQITHPEIEPLTPEKQEGKRLLEPVYTTTEKLKARGLGARQMAKLTQALFLHLSEKDLPENVPASIREQLSLPPRFLAYQHIHFPPDRESYESALRRLKFEELFMAQLRLGLIRLQRHRFSQGVVFNRVGDIFNGFYRDYLPFELTGAQKRVLKEIRKDTASGRQMNRLLQGDVGLLLDNK